ncbi:MAG TPA: hypothetical protein VEC16_00325 [Alphaproteobacteria bacterium]|nr:hypothetical protein [Alphaproteobacteria bacterium]
MPLEYDISARHVCYIFKDEYEKKAKDMGYNLSVGFIDNTVKVNALYTKWNSFLYNTGSEKSKKKLEELIGKEFKYYVDGVAGEGELHEKFPVEIGYVTGSQLLKRN